MAASATPQGCRAAGATGSTDAELALGPGIQWSPEQAVQSDHEQAQDHGTENTALEVARRARSGNVGAEAVRHELLLTPRGYLGRDARVPRPARSRDCASHV